MKLVIETWEPWELALRKGQEIAVTWMHYCEVLVGRTA